MFILKIIDYFNKCKLKNFLINLLIIFKIFSFLNIIISIIFLYGLNVIKIYL